MTIAFTDRDGGKKNALIIVSLDGSDRFYAFVGISTAQRFSADKKKYEIMATSFRYKP